MSTREERTKSYQNFSQRCEPLFNGFWEKIKLSLKLKPFDKLEVCPQGAMGGMNEKLIEVFFPMEYHSWSKKSEGDSIKEEANLIYGARLEYRLTDNGYVFCILTPSRTDYFKPSEDGILIEIIKKPNKLEIKAKKHWKYLLSYMQVTNVDGQASMLDRAIVGYLRYWKVCFKDGESQPRNVVKAFKFMLHWMLSVGLSGLLIFFITLYLNDKQENEVVSHLKGTSDQLDNVLNEQRFLLESVNNIRSGLKDMAKNNSVLHLQKLSENDVILQEENVDMNIKEKSIHNY